MSVRFTLFETAFGWCALAWSEAGIVRGWLPDSEAAVRTSIGRRCPDAEESEPAGFAAEAVEAVKALMAEGRADLSHLPLDLTGILPLHARLYDIARAIPPGETLTYGEAAQMLGDKNLAREVGRALGLNPFPPIVPCHRILAASGKTGGFSAPGGVETKLRLLNVEKARTSAAPSLFDDLPLAAAPRR